MCSGIAQTFRSGVANTAALGCSPSANTCVPRGKDTSLPEVVVAGSCNRAKRGLELHFVMQFPKLAVADFDLAQFSCLNIMVCCGCIISSFQL